jgi:hypothetical protein
MALGEQRNTKTIGWCSREDEQLIPEDSSLGEQA